MNKNDIKLVFFLCFVCIIFIFFFEFFSKKGKSALVYYDGNLIKTIDLSSNSNYVVEGFNGSVFIDVKDGMIRVNSENSPYHLCSKQGYIGESHDSIVCLPNKIVINISSDLEEYDAVVK